MLLPYHTKELLECGVDESGIGTLCGSVYAGAVIWSPELDPNDPEISEFLELLNDSKKLTKKQRFLMKDFIEAYAIDYSVGMATKNEVDNINILNARLLAMHRALDNLCINPQSIIVDGDKFNDYKDIPHHLIVKGDSIYQSIACASILAKCAKDTEMAKYHEEYPHYGWDTNCGYPSKKHLHAIKTYGLTPYHRTSYGPCKNVCLIRKDS